MSFLEAENVEILPGTLDLMVLRILDTMGPMHAYDVATRLEQVSEEALQINQGTLYPALVRLDHKGWVVSKWQTTENNRRAKYYALTSAGRKQLRRETKEWARMSAIIGRLLEPGV
jgi:PadR family transcriptional regulator PadR